ncbi:hypothetical protein [Helicobacter sp.]|uniref:hypothetical protein n=1 Tax=Helicobacter sp. TaxID=218 RepID=UPI0019BA99A0|nr:hypothetical protein [Helicobacter sp.]MBD5164588.1 hypothetical protein [Helicobacter sp.]
MGIQGELSKASFDFSDMANVINLFFDCSEQYYEIRVDDETEKRLLEKVVSQYYDHVTAYGVSVNGVCPYKMLAWSGYILCRDFWEKGKQDFAVKFLVSAIVAADMLLKKEEVELHQEILLKAVKMVKSELEGKTHIGLGMNGLYMIFRAISLQYSK